MARVKCPHCGAGNREGSVTATCWQCGKNLWDPVERHTYALGDAPQLGETTSYDPRSFGGEGPASPRWKLWLALGFALLSLVALVMVVSVYLSETAGSRP